MTNLTRSLIDRRNFLKAAGVLLATSATGFSVARLRPGGAPLGGPVKGINLAGAPTRQFFLAAGDGWCSIGDPANIAAMAPFWPDPSAPAPYDVWIMGFQDVYDIRTSTEQIMNRIWQAQFTAPLIYINDGENFSISLRNIGLHSRPDLVDSHTVHFHGFPNQIPYFDGVPDSSLAAPIGRELVYQYIPEDPGTYMYHCHFEDVEHVHMGLQGQVFVQPNLPKLQAMPGYDATKGSRYAYYHPDAWFDRQFSIHLDEVDVHTHYNDAHLQISDWSAFQPNFRVMNGRSYPDTLLDNRDKKHPGAYSSTDPGSVTESPGYPARLRYNPLSALVQGNVGERVLVRLSNLGYEEHSLVLDGIPMTVIGDDAKLQLGGRPDYYGNAVRANIARITDRVDLGPGESRDLLLDLTGVAPGAYPLYDRNYAFTANKGGAADGLGGMRTEVRVSPAGTLAAQPAPHALVDPL